MDEDVRDEVDLAEEEKKEGFEAYLLTLINKLKDSGKEEIKEGEIRIKLNEEGGYDVFATIAEPRLAKIRQDNVVEYDFEGLETFKKLQEEAEKQGIIKCNLPEGFPDPEYLKQTQKERQQKQGEKDSDRKDEIQDGKIEKEGKEEKTEDKDKVDNDIVQEKGGDWIPIRDDRQADEYDTVHNEIEKATGEKTERFYLAPDPKSSLKYELMMKVEGGYKEVHLEKEEGTNPTNQITRINNDDATQASPAQMFNINNKRFIAIYHAGTSEIEADMVNQTDKGDFVGTEIVNNQQANAIEYPSPEIRRILGDTRSNQIKLDRQNQAFIEITELDKRNVPTRMNPAKDGIEAKELDLETFINNIIQEIENDISELVDRQDKRRQMAEQIATKVIRDDEDYEKSKNEVIEANKDKTKDSDDEYGPWSGLRERPRG